MAKISWIAVGALALGCVAGCGGGPQSAPGGRVASAEPSVVKPSVVVTWQPRDKTAEFLSGWRPKD